MIILAIVGLKGTLKSQKCADIGNFLHVFAILRYRMCCLVVKSLRILVEEVISFYMSDVTSKLDEY